jgi:hypothetical protein
MMDDGDAFKLPTITTMNLLIREARRCVGRPAPPPHQTNRAVVTGNPDMQRPFLSRNKIEERFHGCPVSGTASTSVRLACCSG